MHVSASLDSLRLSRAGQESALSRGEHGGGGLRNRLTRGPSLQDLLEAQEQRVSREFLPQICLGPRSWVEMGEADFPAANVSMQTPAAAGEQNSPWKMMKSGSTTEPESPMKLMEAFARQACQWPKHQARELQLLYEAYRSERNQLKERSPPGKGAATMGMGNAELHGRMISFDYLLRTYFPHHNKAEIAAMSEAVQAIDQAEMAEQMKSARRREISKLFNSYTQGRDCLGIGEFKLMLESVPGAFSSDISCDPIKYVSQMQDIFSAMDTDGNGTIDLKEFISAVEEHNLFSSALAEAQMEIERRRTRRPSLADISLDGVGGSSRSRFGIPTLKPI